jgi:hypothetical protein
LDFFEGGEALGVQLFEYGPGGGYLFACFVNIKRTGTAAKTEVV